MEGIANTTKWQKKRHNVDIEAKDDIKTLAKENKKEYSRLWIIQYWNEIPFEPFRMQTVFESETTLQHPYEFLGENIL